MATAAGFKTPEMNWDATDLWDELAKFKQYYITKTSTPLL